jgi:hypothetical protein
MTLTSKDLKSYADGVRYQIHRCKATLDESGLGPNERTSLLQVHHEGDRARDVTQFRKCI